MQGRRQGEAAAAVCLPPQAGSGVEAIDFTAFVCLHEFENSGRIIRPGGDVLRDEEVLVGEILGADIGKGGSPTAFRRVEGSIGGIIGRGEDDAVCRAAVQVDLGGGGRFRFEGGPEDGQRQPVGADVVAGRFGGDEVSGGDADFGGQQRGEAKRAQGGAARVHQGQKLRMRADMGRDMQGDAAGESHAHDFAQQADGIKQEDG